MYEEKLYQSVFLCTEGYLKSHSVLNVGVFVGRGVKPPYICSIQAHSHVKMSQLPFTPLLSSAGRGGVVPKVMDIFYCCGITELSLGHPPCNPMALSARPLCLITPGAMTATILIVAKHSSGGGDGFRVMNSQTKYFAAQTAVWNKGRTIAGLAPSKRADCIKNSSGQA